MAGGTSVATTTCGRVRREVAAGVARLKAIAAAAFTRGAIKAGAVAVEGGAIAGGAIAVEGGAVGSAAVTVEGRAVTGGTVTIEGGTVSATRAVAEARIASEAGFAAERRLVAKRWLVAEGWFSGEGWPVGGGLWTIGSGIEVDVLILRAGSVLRGRGGGAIGAGLLFFFPRLVEGGARWSAIGTRSGAASVRWRAEGLGTIGRAGAELTGFGDELLDARAVFGEDGEVGGLLCGAGGLEDRQVPCDVKVVLALDGDGLELAGAGEGVKDIADAGAGASGERKVSISSSVARMDWPR